MTLFSLAAEENEIVFRQALDRFCDGRADERKLDLLGPLKPTSRIGTTTIARAAPC